MEDGPNFFGLLRISELYYKSMQNSVWLDCPKCPWIVMSLQYLWKQYSYWKKRQSPSLTRQFMGRTSSALLNMCVKSCYLQPFFIILYLKSFYPMIDTFFICNSKFQSTTDVIERVTWKSILYQFIKKSKPCLFGLRKWLDPVVVIFFKNAKKKSKCWLIQSL